MKRREFLEPMRASALASLLPLGTAVAAAPLKVAVMIPLSGPAGLFGPSSRNCSELAVEEINSGGGLGVGR